MAFEDDSKTMLIGFIIVLIVGLNMILFFGEMTGLGGNALTGAAAINCKDVANGVQCGSSTFVLAAGGTCPYSMVAVCTNNCELARAYANDNRVCPTACTDICVTTDLAKKL